MMTLVTRFSFLLAGLRAAIAPIAARSTPTQTALLILVWTRAARAAGRFERLFVRWRAGTLPARRTRHPGTACAPRAAVPRLPNGHAWLIRRFREVAPCASQLQSFLATPELTAFLADAPQAGRLLRPLCHMLGVAMPPAPAPQSAPVPQTATAEPAPTLTAERPAFVPSRHFSSA